ncbi:large ribosomal subunit protein eL21-like [Physella acuta]|uniref:large ribosomal subunit protein eL21-like n=1 Tax=Physella acuta TaxID=109671 RepID=UPI0027DB7463|nr:large ribosomal subunit protein eL21-like [Physella acuta]
MSGDYNVEVPLCYGDIEDPNSKRKKRKLCTMVIWDITEVDVSFDGPSRVQFTVLGHTTEVEQIVDLILEHSNCRLDFLKRVEKNEELKRQAKEIGVKANTKRDPAQPRKAHFVSKPDFLTPIPYEIIA